MKTSFKNEVRDFKVTGVTTGERKGETLVELAFSAQAKGRLVAWNNISGSTILNVARIATKGFGPKDISFRDFGWVVHITRRGKPVTRRMKSTPRKAAINHALTQLLAPALLGADTHPDRPFVEDKEVAPTVARKRTRKSKEDPGLIDAVMATLTNVPASSETLEMPEFLKR